MIYDDQKQGHQEQKGSGRRQLIAGHNQHPEFVQPRSSLILTHRWVLHPPFMLIDYLRVEDQHTKPEQDEHLKHLRIKELAHNCLRSGCSLALYL